MVRGKFNHMVGLVPLNSEPFDRVPNISILSHFCSVVVYDFYVCNLTILDVSSHHLMFLGMC